MVKKAGTGLAVFGALAVIYSILWFVGWMTETPPDPMHVSVKLWDLYFAAPLLFVAGLLMLFRTRLGAWLGTAAYAVLFYGSNMDMVGAYFHGDVSPGPVDTRGNHVRPGAGGRGVSGAVGGEERVITLY